MAKRKQTIIYSGVVPNGGLEVLSTRTDVLVDPDDHRIVDQNKCRLNSMSNPHDSGWIGIGYGASDGSLSSALRSIEESAQ